jgi:hypothetical protein
MGIISDFFDEITGADNAEKAAREGSRIAGDAALEGSELAGDMIRSGTATAGNYSQAGLNYLKQADLFPRTISTDAKRRMAGLYGLEGGYGNQGALIGQARSSPLYDAIMQTRQAGEDAILRNASATGGLRSGNVQSNLYQYNQQLKANALNEAYAQQLAGLEGLAAMPTNENAIANQFSEIGQRRGQGLVLEGQTRGGGIAEQGRLLGLGETAAGNAQAAGRGGLLNAALEVAGAAAGNPNLF